MGPWELAVAARQRLDSWAAGSAAQRNWLEATKDAPVSHLQVRECCNPGRSGSVCGVSTCPPRLLCKETSRYGHVPGSEVQGPGIALPNGCEPSCDARKLQLVPFEQHLGRQSRFLSSNRTPPPNNLSIASTDTHNPRCSCSQPHRCFWQPLGCSPPSLHTTSSCPPMAGSASTNSCTRTTQ